MNEDFSSRAKYALVIVGNARVLARHQTWNQLIHHFHAMNAIVDGPGNDGPRAVQKMVQVSLSLTKKKDKPRKPLPLVDVSEYLDESDAVTRSRHLPPRRNFNNNLFGGSQQSIVPMSFYARPYQAPPPPPPPPTSMPPVPLGFFMNHGGVAPPPPQGYFNQPLEESNRMAGGGDYYYHNSTPAELSEQLSASGEPKVENI